MKGKIFISYRRAADRWAVDTVRKELVAAFGEDNVFFDAQTLDPGDDWLKRLDTEISRASVVLVLYCKEWLGPSADGTRRIDHEGDMVRREVELAQAHRRVVIPVVIDDSPQPSANDLPASLRFLLKHQFLPLQPDEQLPQRIHRLVQAIERAHPGRLFSRRYYAQVTWLALMVTALVGAWYVRGGNVSYENAFARNALAMRLHVGLDAAAAPASFGEEFAELAWVDIDDAEFSILFAGQRPLDPQVMSLVLRALHAASTPGSCGADRPVAINLDLSPDVYNPDDPETSALRQALVKLAQCRPVVLACPTSVVRRVAAEDDMRWMSRVQQDANHQLFFTHSRPDPSGLRHSESGDDIGIVVAEIASGRKTVAQQAQQADSNCACPASPQALALCGSERRRVSWDRTAMAVPFVKSPYSLSGALLDMPRLARKKIILIGGSFGSQAVYAVPGRAGEPTEGATDTLMQGYLLHGAMHHQPVPWRPWMAMLAISVSWLLTAAILAFGVVLQRNDQRFARRVPAYLGAGLLMLGVPVLALLAAAMWPAWTWLAALMAVLGVLTMGRALLAAFEVVLAGGMTFKTFPELWRDLRFDQDKVSVLMHLSAAVFERLLLPLAAFGLIVLWWN